MELEGERERGGWMERKRVQNREWYRDKKREREKERCKRRRVRGEDKEKKRERDKRQLERVSAWVRDR